MIACYVSLLLFKAMCTQFYDDVFKEGKKVRGSTSGAVVSIDIR